MKRYQQDQTKKLFMIILGCIPTYIYIATTCVDPVSISHKILHDDSYYYLGVAKGWIDYQFPTINGIQPTNGFHPGYQYLLFLTSKLFTHAFSIQSRLATLYAYCLIGLVSQTTCLLALETSARRYFGFQINTIFTFSFLFSSLTFFWFYNGMETGLVIALLSVYVNNFPRLLRVKSLSITEYLKLYFLSLMLVLSRLDIVVPWALTIIAVIVLRRYGYHLTEFSRSIQLIFAGRKPLQQLKIQIKGPLLLLISVPLTIYTFLAIQALILNISSLSISSSVKGFWSSQARHEACSLSAASCIKIILVEPFLNSIYMIGDSMSQLFAYLDIRFAYNSDPIYLPGVIYILIALAIFSLPILTLLKIQTVNTHNPIQRLDTAVILTSPLLIGAFLIGFMSYSLSFNSRSFQWYLYIWDYLLIFYLCGLYGKVQQSITVMSLSKVHKKSYKRLLPMVCVTLALFRLIQLITSSNSGWAIVYDAAVNKINQSPPTNLSTWAAGHICFYSDAPCTNLEGLVHNDTILNLNKDKSLDKYLVDQSIIITNQLYPSTPGDIKKLSPFDRLRAEPLSKVSNRFKLEDIFTDSGDKMTLIYRAIN